MGFIVVDYGFDFFEFLFLVLVLTCFLCIEGEVAQISQDEIGIGVIFADVISEEEFLDLVVLGYLLAVFADFQEICA